jgi:hypothetical protein
MRHGHRAMGSVPRSLLPAAHGSRRARAVCMPGVLALALASLSPSAASATPAPPAASATPASTAPAPADPEGGPRDTNDPDPDRDALNWARGVANLGLVNWGIWQANWLRGADWPHVSRATLSHNLRHGFAFDADELQTNFFGHPYHGGLNFTSARAAGLSFWESIPYAFAGSLVWELFGEREVPSTNDLVVTVLGGIVLGEITYRLSSELLDDTTSGSTRLLREIGAAAVSPMRGFNRLYTGEAWQTGRPPIRNPVHVALQGGAGYVWAGEDGTGRRYAPTLLVASQVDYGSLYPFRADQTLEPFQFFELYGAVNLLNSELQGGQVYANALLFGFSSDISRDTGTHTDNNVFGLSMSYDYQGANVATYAGAGIGPANYTVLRFDSTRRLRLGLGLDFVPIVGITSSRREQNVRNYNYGSGAALWTSLLLDLDRLGRLGLRSRQYMTTIVGGDGGNEAIGATRLSYEIDVVPGAGIGVAPTVVQKQGWYDDGTRSFRYQLDTQLYLSVHN